MNIGVSGTISLTCVGHITGISRRVHMYLSAYITYDLFLSTTILRYPLGALFIAVKNSVAATMINTEWSSFLLLFDAS